MTDPNLRALVQTDIIMLISNCWVPLMSFVIGLGASAGCSFAGSAHSGDHGADDTRRSEELLALASIG